MIDKIIIVFIHSWLVSYDFLNLYCSNLLKNPTVRGLTVVCKQIYKN